jgi:hypothetical protein
MSLLPFLFQAVIFAAAAAAAAAAAEVSLRVHFVDLSFSLFSSFSAIFLADLSGWSKSNEIDLEKVGTPRILRVKVMLQKKIARLETAETVFSSNSNSIGNVRDLDHGCLHFPHICISRAFLSTGYLDSLLFALFSLCVRIACILQHFWHFLLVSNFMLLS